MNKKIQGPGSRMDYREYVRNVYFPSLLMNFFKESVRVLKIDGDCNFTVSWYNLDKKSTFRNSLNY